MPYVNKGLSTKICSLTKKVSGSTITINNQFGDRLLDLKALVTSIQSGSGNPSPSNDRPIIGRDSVDLSVNSVITRINLGGTYYGCILDVTNGVLIVDRKYKKATDMVWNEYLYSQVYSITDTDNSVTVDYPTGRRPIMCNRYIYDDSATIIPNVRCGWGGTTNNKNLFVRDSVNASSLAVWESFIANNEVEFVYYIEPFTIQLTPTQIDLIAGNNTIFADSGDVEAIYKTFTP